MSYVLRLSEEELRELTLVDYTYAAQLLGTLDELTEGVFYIAPGDAYNFRDAVDSEGWMPGVSNELAVKLGTLYWETI